MRRRIKWLSGARPGCRDFGAGGDPLVWVVMLLAMICVSSWLSELVISRLSSFLHSPELLFELNYEFDSVEPKFENTLFVWVRG